jgi:hypothetical protein
MISKSKQDVDYPRCHGEPTALANAVTHSHMLIRPNHKRNQPDTRVCKCCTTLWPGAATEPILGWALSPVCLHGPWTVERGTWNMGHGT